MGRLLNILCTFNLRLVSLGYRTNSIKFWNVKGTPSSLRQFLANESHLKMMKNGFYFTLKPLFVLKILNCCLNFLVMWKNGLIRKMLISKFMTSQPGKQTIAMHIWSNISRRKCNRTMKFGQLIEDNMKNIFL